MSTEIVGHEVARMIMAEVERRTESINGVARELSDRGGLKLESATRTLRRLKEDVDSGGGLSALWAGRLLSVVGYEGEGALGNFLADMADGDEASLLAKLGQNFLFEEEEAQAVRNDAGADYAADRVFGSVIEIRRFRDVSDTQWRLGIRAEHVALSDTGFAFPLAEPLRWPTIDVPQPNRGKFGLLDIQPAAPDDANAGTITLRLSRLSYKDIAQCDPSIYRDYQGQDAFDYAGRYINNGKRVEMRRRYGSLDPSRSQVPYALTLFYIVRLLDQKVVVMRRNRQVKWFPGTIEFTGGEQLRTEDLEHPQPFVAWLQRAVREEVLPTSHLEREEAAELERRFYGQGYLCGVGYDINTCSFPIFALYDSRCTEADYVRLYAEAKRRRSATAPDREGSLALMSYEEIRLLLTRGRARMRSLVMDRDQVAFQLRLGDEDGGVKLSSKDLHPMSAYRLGLLVDFVGHRIGKRT